MRNLQPVFIPTPNFRSQIIPIINYNVGNTIFGGGVVGGGGVIVYGCTAIRGGAAIQGGTTINGGASIFSGTTVGGVDGAIGGSAIICSGTVVSGVDTAVGGGTTVDGVGTTFGDVTTNYSGSASIGGVGTTVNGGALSGEVSNKQNRGRPHGFNKMLKTISTQLIILNIPPRTDIIQSVVKFALEHELCLSILSGYGLVSEFDICYPGCLSLPVEDISGMFQLISFTGTFSGCASSSSSLSSSCFIVSVAGFEGDVFCGLIANRMKAASQVVLVCSSFRNPNIYKLPCDSKLIDVHVNPTSNSDSGAGGFHGFSIDGSSTKPINFSVSGFGVSSSP